MYTNLQDDPTWEQRRIKNRHEAWVNNCVAGVWLAIGVAFALYTIAVFS